MTNLLRSSSCENQEYRVIEELSTLLRSENGKLVLSGQTKLVLTVSSLSCLNRKLRNVTSDDIISNELCSINSGSADYSHYDNIQFLRQFVNGVLTLKIIPGSGTVQGCVDLRQFTSLKVLELERIPIHLFKGLQYLRSRLQIISCRRCVTSIEDLFAVCGGDHSLPFPWSELVAARLSYNDITYLDESLRLLPFLVSLDLSHNNICIAEGIEFLSKLENLNLSYNCLRHFPSQTKACINLKVLFLKNNCLETLEGLECLRNLKEVDLSYNCLVDHCTLFPFVSLTDIKQISLGGNPISYHNDHRILTLQHLNFKAVSTNTFLDGKCFSYSEIKKVKNARANPSVCEWCTGDISLNSIRGRFPIDASGSRAYTEDRSCASSICEMQSSGELSTGTFQSQQRPKKSRKKTLAVREAQIDDEATMSENQKLYVPFNLVVPAEVSSYEHLQTKREIEMCRQQHGKEWLIIGTRLSVLTNSCQEDPSDCQTQTENISEVNSSQVECRQSNFNDSIARRSQVSDDVIVLNEEPECPPSSSFEPYNAAVMQISNASESLSPELDKSASKEVSSDEEDNDSSQPFIVHMERPGSDEATLILLVLSGNELREKTFLTGRTIDRLDLRSIQSFETLLPKVTLIDGHECELPRVCLTFNHVRKDRGKRIYSMEDEQSFNVLIFIIKEFCELIKPIADFNTFQTATVGALQCLKCHSHFSKEMVSKMVRSNNRPDDIIVLSSSSSSSKDLFQRVNACPNCLSEMIIEIDASDTDYLKLDSDQTVTVEQNVSSKPVLRKERSSESLGSSCPNVIKADNWLQPIVTSSSLSNTVPEYKTTADSSVMTSTPRKVYDEAEVHPTLSFSSRDQQSGMNPNSMTAHDGNLQRWESDLTILSNPSQSSILVIAHQTADGNLDVIPEDNDPKRSGVLLGSVAQNSSYISSTRLTKLGSCSSDSLTDSACTAVENQTRYNSMQLAQTPESYLSAFSGTNKTINSISRSESAKLSEKMAHGMHLDAHHSVKPIHIGNQHPLLWSCRDGDVVYSFRDFGYVDHRLKLHLDMQVLDDNEEVIALLRAGVIVYLKGEEVPGLLIMSRTKIHIMKITSEKEFSPNWLQKIDCLPTNTLAYINVHLGSQAFQMEFACKPSPVCFTFLLRDDDHCNSFVCSVMDKVKNGEFDLDSSRFAVDLDSEETLQVIREQLFTWRNGKDGRHSPSNSAMPTSPDEESDDTNVYFYVMCYWLPLGDETTYRPISIVVTKTNIYFFSENLVWPLPHLISPSNEFLNTPQLIPQIREKIQDLISVTKIENRPFQVLLKFLDEDSGDELDVRVAMETEHSLGMLIQALKDPWERLFGVELQILLDN